MPPTTSGQVCDLTSYIGYSISIHFLSDSPSSAGLGFSSCEDVRSKGLMKNGYYTIKGKKKYCYNWSEF